MSAQPQPTRTYDFTGGQPAVADAVDTDLNTLYTVLQGGVGNTHIAADAAIGFSKMAATAMTLFNPVWTGLTLGNGTSISYYQQIGKWVLWKGRLICGSTTNTTGTGTPIYCTLPVAALATATVGDYGSSQITNSSSGTNSPAFCVITSATQLFFYAGTDNTQAVAGGYPTGYLTAGAGNSTGDSVSWTILYEAA